MANEGKPMFSSEKRLSSQIGRSINWIITILFAAAVFVLIETIFGMNTPGLITSFVIMLLLGAFFIRNMPGLFSSSDTINFEMYKDKFIFYYLDKQIEVPFNQINYIDTVELPGSKAGNYSTRYTYFYLKNGKREDFYLGMTNQMAEPKTFIDVIKKAGFKETTKKGFGLFGKKTFVYLE